jgi:hypothetical protein
MMLFNDIEQCIPGFEDYNKRVVQKGGFYLPNGPRDGISTVNFIPEKPLSI